MFLIIIIMFYPFSIFHAFEVNSERPPSLFRFRYIVLHLFIAEYCTVHIYKTCVFNSFPFLCSAQTFTVVFPVFSNGWSPHFLYCHFVNHLHELSAISGDFNQWIVNNETNGLFIIGNRTHKCWFPFFLPAPFHALKTLYSS